MADEDLGFIPENQEEDLGFIPEEQPAMEADLGFVPEAPTRPGTAPKQESGTYLSNVSQAEINAIASKHKVDPNWLKQEINFYGGAVEGEEVDLSSAVLGALGRGPAMSLPQFLARRGLDKKNSAALEEMIDVVERRKPTTATVVDLVTGLLTPGLGSAGAVAKGASVAAKLGRAASSGAVIGAVSSALTSKPGEELEEAAIGAGIGAAFGAGLIGVPAGVRKVLSAKRDATAAAVEKDLGAGVSKIMQETSMPNKFEADGLINYINKKPLTDLQKQAIELNAIRLNPETTLTGDELINLRLESLAKQTMKNISAQAPKGNKKIAKELQRLVKDEGEDFVKNSYSRAREVEAVSEVFKKNRKDTSGTGFGLLSWMDNKYVAKFIDSKLGTNVDELIDNMSQANLAKDHLTEYYNKKLATLSNATKKAGVKPEDIFNYIQSKGQTGIDPKAANVVAEYQQLFRDLRQEAIDLGLPIRELGQGQWYVPNKVKGTEDLLTALRGRARELETSLGFNPLGHLSDDEFKALQTTDSGKEFIKALEVGSGKKIGAAGQFNQFAPQVLNPSGEFIKDLSVASSTMAREGDIPSFILETNIDAAAQRWMNSTFQRALFREHEGELRKLRDQFRASGETQFYKWTDMLIKDITGSARPGTAKTFFRQQATKWKLFTREKIEQASNPVTKELWQTAHDVPEIMDTLSANLYSNVLGTKPRALVSNLMQPLVLTAPELGTKYGFEVAARVGDTWHDVIKNGREAVVRNPVMARKLGVKIGDVVQTKNITEFMELQGLLAPMSKIVNSPSFKAGIEQGLLASGAEKATELTSKAGILYGIAEKWNREWIAGMAMALSDDLMKGSKDATKYLNRLDEGYRRSISGTMNKIKGLEAAGQDSLAKQERVLLTEKVMKHLLSKTAFNYDRYSASRFARSAGPMLSMFTKWPTSIAGDWIYSAKDPRFDAIQKASGFWEKYMAPAMMMYAIHQGAKATDVADTEAYQTLAGKGKFGLASAMPIASGLGLFTGDVRTVPPLVESVVKAGGGIAADPLNIEGNAKKVWDAAKPFVPGTGIWRIATEDLPALIGE